MQLLGAVQSPFETSENGDGPVRCAPVTFVMNTVDDVQRERQPRRGLRHNVEDRQEENDCDTKIG